jgi:flagellar biosynthesis/type III secretory pathway M-ring protein FliF/YscJ
MTAFEVLQLNIANAVLGVATLICVAMMAWGIVSEVVARIRANAAAAVPDDHSFVLPELGLTMADGGEKVDDKKKTASK